MENHYPLPDADIVFNAKPDAIPYNYRISYKVSQICLILRICGRGNVCSLVKLHMISFGLISNHNMEQLKGYADGAENSPIVRFDPAVNRALSFATAYNFIEQQKTGKYKLTVQGQRLADQIILAENLMVSEISNLNALAKKLTENRIDALIERWRRNHA